MVWQHHKPFHYRVEAKQRRSYKLLLINKKKQNKYIPNKGKMN